MAWPMSTPNQWNQIMQNPNTNPGPITPDQWTAMQHQNWSQWAQWQQQYAQWQTQYSDKFSQQMQAMAVMPPLPTQAAAPPPPAPPPAPPPPDNPPPPPHENNQPLFAQLSVQSSQNQNAGFNNVNPSGNNSQKSQQPARPEASTTQVSVNAEALKKLAEEERLFDIQFQKWEEEIEKWKQDNIDHPDKQAYQEYEQKFESCRVQLLERRQQMNQKKARLLSSITTTSASTTGNNNVPAPIIPVQATNAQTYSHTMQTQPHQSHQFHQPRQLLQRNQPNQSNQPMRPRLPMSIQTVEKKQPLLLLPQQPKQAVNYSNYNNIMSAMPQQLQSYQNAPSYNNTNNTPYQQHYVVSQTDYQRNVNKCVDPQDRLEAYQSMEGYSQDDNSAFIQQSEPNKGIPGLDLVSEHDKSASCKQLEVVDITQEQTVSQRRGPDYTTISKGINNILGDAKIMNILSKVLVQGIIGSENTDNDSNVNTSRPSPSDAPKQWDSKNTSNQYGNRQNMLPTRQGQQNQQARGPLHMTNNMPSHMAPKIPSLLSLPMGQKQNDVIRGQNDVNRGQNNVNRGQNDVNRGQNNVNRGQNDVNRGQNDVNRGQNDVNRGQNNVNRGQNDVNRGQNEFTRGQKENIIELEPQPAGPKWGEVQLFTPCIIVEYDHKALRLKARDFIEPVHLFEYNHISKDDEYKKRDFNREVDDLFIRKSRKLEREDERFSKDSQSRDYERRVPREEPPREESRLRVPPRDEYEERRRPEPRYDDRYDDKRRDDRDKYSRREEIYSRERERARPREHRRSNSRGRERERERERDRDSRKRERSKESIHSNISKKSKDEVKPSPLVHADIPKHVVMIDDILEPPARDMRPAKIVIILRGPPGSGKSYLAKLIRDREAEFDCTARIMSIDDYFMQENEVEERDPVTGKMVKKPTMNYEYDDASEESYLSSLKRAFKRSITDGYFSFLIYDAVNDQLKSYADIWNFARQNGFQVYICTMEMDPHICFKRNIHNRSLEDIEIICSRFFPTPAHHIQLDPTNLLQNASITEVHMEDVTNDTEEIHADEVESVFASKWEKMDDANKLARLDGTSKPLRPSQLSMEDYLQIDEWTPNKAQPGKKTVLHLIKQIITHKGHKQKTREMISKDLPKSILGCSASSENDTKDRDFQKSHQISCTPRNLQTENITKMRDFALSADNLFAFGVELTSEMKMGTDIDYHLGDIPQSPNPINKEVIKQHIDLPEFGPSWEMKAKNETEGEGLNKDPLVSSASSSGNETSNCLFPHIGLDDWYTVEETKVTVKRKKKKRSGNKCTWASRKRKTLIVSPNAEQALVVLNSEIEPVDTNVTNYPESGYDNVKRNVCELYETPKSPAANVESTCCSPRRKMVKKRIPYISCTALDHNEVTPYIGVPCPLNISNSLSADRSPSTWRSDYKALEHVRRKPTVAGVLDETKCICMLFQAIQIHMFEKFTKTIEWEERSEIVTLQRGLLNVNNVNSRRLLTKSQKRRINRPPRKKRTGAKYNRGEAIGDGLRLPVYKVGVRQVHPLKFIRTSSPVTESDWGELCKGIDAIKINTATETVKSKGSEVNVFKHELNIRSSPKSNETIEKDSDSPVIKVTNIKSLINDFESSATESYISKFELSPSKLKAIENRTLFMSSTAVRPEKAECFISNTTPETAFKKECQMDGEDFQKQRYSTGDNESENDEDMYDLPTIVIPFVVKSTDIARVACPNMKHQILFADAPAHVASQQAAVSYTVNHKNEDLSPTIKLESDYQAVNLSAVLESECEPSDLTDVTLKIESFVEPETKERKK